MLKLPAPLLRAWRDAQLNFDHLAKRAVERPTDQSANTPAAILGTAMPFRVSEIRITTANMVVGVAALPLTLTGFTAFAGIWVIYIQPATHNTFTWYPRAGDIVFNNTGVLQSVTVRYMLVGN